MYGIKGSGKAKLEFQKKLESGKLELQFLYGTFGGLARLALLQLYALYRIAGSAEEYYIIISTPFPLCPFF